MKYITTSAATTIVDGSTELPSNILIQVNAALTGTITVGDGATGGTTRAVITNPTVGSSYRYYGLAGTIKVTASTTCDITVSVLSRNS